MKPIVVFEDIGLKDYKETWDYQESVMQEIIAAKLAQKTEDQRGSIPLNRIIFVEHPHVYTLGKSGTEKNLLLDHIQLQTKEAVFYKTNRGGDITYHGPGQMVGYPILDLEQMRLSLREYVFRLEESVIITLSHFGLKGERLSGATGVWLDPQTPGKARKICAIGIRSSHFVTMHGFAFNVNTDLTYFNYINPCGFIDKGVTSLKAELGREIAFGEAKEVMKMSLQKVLGIEWLN